MPLLRLDSRCRRAAALGLPLVLVLALGACGGGGGGGGGNAVFVDSGVEGLDYVAGNVKAVTGPGGRFSASPGTTVLFALGDVVLGLAPFERQLSPLSLVPGAMDETDPTVTHIAQLLQSLDDDGDPADGIRIVQAVRDAGVGLTLQFDQSPATFPTDPAVQALLAAAGAPGLVPAGDAQAHLAASLRGSYAGQYVGTYGGDDTGSFNVFIDRSGELVGAAFSNGDQDVFGVSGTVALDGSGVFGNTTDQSTFQGTVGAGLVDGTWDNAIFATAGTFSGTLREAPAFVLDPVALAPFVGTYVGTFTVPGETGAFTVVVDAGGDLNISDGDPGEVSATILDVAGGVATFRGVADDGTEIRGTLLDDGTLSGTLRNVFDGEAGTFTGSM